VCNDACLAFAEATLSRSDINGKRVLEIGALNFNGSVRSAITQHTPESHLGTDISIGPGVDDVCNVVELARKYGREQFDLVICTEVLEHVRDWQAAVSNIKAVMRPGGVLLLTTRSKGFPYHGYPFDFWRFEISDFRVIFSDLDVEALQSDPQAPGVFLMARKPDVFEERVLSGLELFSIVSKTKCERIGDFDIALLRARHGVRAALARALPDPLKRLIRRIYPDVSGAWRD